MKITTYYFRVKFGYTDEDIDKMRKDFYVQDGDGYFIPPKKELILKVECSIGNPFMKLGETLASPIYAENYDSDIAPTVTIEDCTKEIADVIQRNNDGVERLYEMLGCELK